MSANVFADSPRQYFGIFLSDAQFDPDKGSNTDYGNLNIKFGYDLTSFLGVELQAGTNVSTDNDKAGDTNYAAGFIRGDLPYKFVNLYGLVGYGTVTADTPSFDDSVSDLAYGVGLELYGTDTTAFSIEYMQYGVDDIYKTFGVGIVHHFNWPRLHSKHQ
jgi:hypothetical protein